MKSRRGLFIILLGIHTAFPSACQDPAKETRVANEALRSSEEALGDYWFDTPDGRRIIYTPVDSQLVITFSERMTIARKQEIFSQLHLQWLNLPRHSPAPAKITDTTVVVRVVHGTSDAVRVKLLNEYRDEVRGALPAFTHEGSSSPSFLRPTRFGVVFHLEVHQNSVRALLRRHAVAVPSHWVEEHLYPFYVMRLAEVVTSQHDNVFEVIRALSKAPEVYSAFPLFVDSGYALRHGPDPISGNHLKVKMKGYDKLDSQLGHRLLVTKTALPEIIRLTSAGHSLGFISDSLDVQIYFVAADSLAALRRLQQLGMSIQSCYSPSYAPGARTVFGRINWRDLEGLMACEIVARIADPGLGAITPLRPD